MTYVQSDACRAQQANGTCLEPLSGTASRAQCFGGAAVLAPFVPATAECAAAAAAAYGVRPEPLEVAVPQVRRIAQQCGAATTQVRSPSLMWQIACAGLLQA